MSVSIYRTAVSQALNIRLQINKTPTNKFVGGTLPKRQAHNPALNTTGR